ncbi:putative DNA binding domain-containing protein [Muricauda sp. SCSIO 64092]|uniref:ATP-binding protein n=1 Tax=Allomuricauda sp. SCSIO 64092 TaxID=2908842 RepID=UPI001FF5F8AC|nr:ATP-binding protein [Muricauda sp. SCSIO 64092]UOY08228.1 putative DNA binding domain-containing protein [Muricauda sp. SCSIO 64092]
MPETQNIEYKQSWHDDYLKWVCGFANAIGGKIYIGKDDNGTIVGVDGVKNLMESIPQKIQNHLGIICDINTIADNGKECIEIIVQPYSVPVSLRGRYYYRSGSVKTELTGIELNEFLLKKAGKTWDAIIENGATIEDIEDLSIARFLNDADKSGRMPASHDLTNQELLEKLRLMQDGKIKRGALILFGKDPNKFYPNVAVQIGRFGKDDADLRFQEQLEGNISWLLVRVPQLLNEKFLTKQISFEGLQRIEKGEYPVAAIREMLLNAMVHRTYMRAKIQMRVYDNILSIWNEGALPEGLDEESLKVHHVSKPRNPLIADVCFKAGYIDSWGRGTLKIINSCKEAGLPEPEIKEFNGGVLVTLYKDHLSEEQLKQLGLSERQIKAMQYVKENGKITNKEYQELNDVSRITATRDLKELVEKTVLRPSSLKGAGSYYEI